MQKSLTCRCVKSPQTACLLAGQAKSRHFEVLAAHAPNKVLEWMMHRVCHEERHHSKTWRAPLLPLTAPASIVERDTRLRCRRNASGITGCSRSPRRQCCVGDYIFGYRAQRVFIRGGDCNGLLEVCAGLPTSVPGR